MSEYRCSRCSYFYDPQTGDLAHGVSPNTAFEDLPVGWVCPVCSAAKDKFVELKY